MKKTRTMILAGVILLTVTLLITGIAWAEAQKTLLTGTMSADPDPTSAQREWVDDDGIWHVRGMLSDLTFSGNLEGTGISILNVNMDGSTGNGDESGYSTVELSWGDLSGTFEGRYSVTYTGFVGIGHGVYQGGGGFAGMKLIEDWTISLLSEPPYVVALEGGIILDPHGE